MIAPHERTQQVQELQRLARTRSVLTDASDWAAWEVEMTQDVEQDAIRYMEGER